MKLQIFRALWGMSGPVPAMIDQIVAAGYDGIEAWPIAFPEIADAKAWRALIDPHGLGLILGARIRTVDEIEPALTALADYGALKITVHSGIDSMSREDGLKFYEQSLTIEQKLGLQVGHETHRGCALFTPWDTAHYLRTFPELRIVADYSHWVNVCERLPDDQADALTLANSRAIHIHGRVGYPEGPQVPDPAAPEYRAERDWHEAHWLKIAQNQRANGADTVTFTPEYGPPAYLHTLPYTNAPVADLWQVCLQAANRARELFGE